MSKVYKLHPHAHSSLIIFQFLQHNRPAVIRYQVSSIINTSFIFFLEGITFLSISCYFLLHKNEEEIERKLFKLVTKISTPNIVTFSF